MHLEIVQFDSTLRLFFRRRCRDSSSALDRKSTRLNSSHRCISYAVFCLKKNSFEDVTERALVGATGWGMGAFAADYDNDGLTDLYVTSLGRNLLYLHHRHGTLIATTATA